MKLEYSEDKNGLFIVLKPETPKEAAQLLRVANNAKAVKPDLWFNFSGDEPSLDINISKKRPGLQWNSINPFRKK